MSQGDQYTIRPALAWSFSTIATLSDRMYGSITDSCRSLLIASGGGTAYVEVNLTWTQRSLSEVVQFMMFLPRRRAWMEAVNGFRCMIINCLALFWVWYQQIPNTPVSGVQLEHCLVCLWTCPSFLQHSILSILLYRLQTNKFSQSVVALGGRLWRARITCVQGLTLAALRAI